MEIHSRISMALETACYTLFILYVNISEYCTVLPAEINKEKGCPLKNKLTAKNILGLQKQLYLEFLALMFHLQIKLSVASPSNNFHWYSWYINNV